MNLVETAQQTVAIVGAGRYQAAGVEVDLRAAFDRARENTRLYRPEDFAGMEPSASEVNPAGALPVFEVTSETTAAAARRLAALGFDVAALNFASASRPGGGFLSGAVAQEEDLARCSSLHDCLLTKPEYYDANRACGTALYTDHLIYSPRVPFFRDEQLALIPDPFLASVLTSPAPNAGEVLANERQSLSKLDDTLYDRGRQILLVARAHGHRALVLGAWGCGVFKNDPERVAGMFDYHLRKPAFLGAFDRVVFAVYSRVPNDRRRRIFEEQFGL